VEEPKGHDRDWREGEEGKEIEGSEKGKVG